ncbi:MAG TPA: MmgE/PrpD family protein [bacterium]
MSDSLIQRVTRLISEPVTLSPAAAIQVRRAFEDTLAVTYAGWDEPVTRKSAGIVPGGAVLRPGGAVPENLEHTAFVHGVAAHALDYDDVHMTSTTHPSIPIVSALIAARHLRPQSAGRMANAYAVGLAVNLALGRVLGFPHYEKGWHATTTIGPLAAAAAVAHYLELDAQAAAHALALATSQSGGMQRNFGTMAKPVQAGFSASAGYRAAILAQAGITADADTFAAKGFFDLYGGDRIPVSVESIALDLSVEGVCVKLYPCCYMSHRPAGAALQARQVMQAKGIANDALKTVEIVGAKGVFTALRVKEPHTGAEGKFSGPYVVACALVDGQVGLSHFTDEAVRRSDLRAMTSRVTLVERNAASEARATGDGGQIELIGRDGAGKVLVQTEQRAFPGSPDSPPTDAQLADKVRDCLDYYRQLSGVMVSYDEFERGIDSLFLAQGAARSATAQSQRQRAAGD